MTHPSRLQWWVALWSRVEGPESLAAVRIGISGILLIDLLRIRMLGLVATLMGTHEAGGLGVPELLDDLPWLLALLGSGPAFHEGLWWGMTVSCLLLFLGVQPRLSALLVVLLSAQFALVLPAADRGIDMLLRNTLLVLVFAESSATWSLASRWKHGTWTAPASVRVGAWPRYLLALQLVVVYFTAGVSKVASSWTPIGGLSALFIAMSDPHFQRLPDDWLRAGYRLTQVGTFVSWFWEWIAPVLLLAWWYRDTPERPGRLRAWMNARPVVEVYLLIGALFHIGTHLFLRLGIFPFAVMALYPAAVRPEQLRAWTARLRRRR